MSTISTQHDESTQAFYEEVCAGLSKTAKTLPTKYLYDKRGSELFEQICDLDEYYPTRTELQIMSSSAADIASRLGEKFVVLELGSGSSLKTRILLKAMNDPVAYVPFDISPSALDDAFDMLSEEFPDLLIVPVCGDFMSRIELPKIDQSHHGVLTYFPGSTIGNLNHANAIELLKRIRRVDTESDLLLGIDLEKDRDILLAAYNDAAGVTSEFNMNLLRRINVELDADFDLDEFEHRAIYNEDAHRIEMQLISNIDQTVRVGEREFVFEADEAICTEHSHKYTVDRFRELAAVADFEVTEVWSDPKNWFAVMLLKPQRNTTS